MLSETILLKRAEVENAFEWQKWKDKIPFLVFDKEWEVKAVPPYMGAVIRYKIRHIDNPSYLVSVFLDGYNLLGGGSQSEPYWEVYPFPFRRRI